MKKIIFRYSSMNAGKSANLIMNYYNYNELGLNPVAIIPEILEDKKIKTRLGLEIDGIYLKDFLKEKKDKIYGCIFVDESQFLSEKEIETLNEINLNENITVILYGLRTNYKGELFEGTKKILEIADKIEELPTLCSCGNKARMNLRLINGKVDNGTKEIILKNEEVEYTSVCRKCFYKYKHSYIDLSFLFNNSEGNNK